MIGYGMYHQMFFEFFEFLISNIKIRLKQAKKGFWTISPLLGFEKPCIIVLFSRVIWLQSIINYLQCSSDIRCHFTDLKHVKGDAMNQTAKYDDIIQKAYEWPSYTFTKLIPLWEHHLIFSLLSNSSHHPLHSGPQNKFLLWKAPLYGFDKEHSNLNDSTTSKNSSLHQKDFQHKKIFQIHH